MFLRDNPDLAREIDHKLRVALKLVRSESPEAAGPTAIPGAPEGKGPAPVADPGRMRARAPRAPGP